MSLEPVHLVYELSRRQRLVAHLGVWLGDWPGVLLMLAAPAIVVTLAVLKSPWFLAMLLLPPLGNNLPRFLGGLASCLALRSQRVDLVIEPERIGSLVGAEREWSPLEEIVRVERFADVWVILSPGSVIDVPVSVVDPEYIAHVQAMSKEGGKGHGRPAANTRDDAMGGQGTAKRDGQT